MARPVSLAGRYSGSTIETASYWGSGAAHGRSQQVARQICHDEPRSQHCLSVNAAQKPSPARSRPQYVGCVVGLPVGGSVGAPVGFEVVGNTVGAPVGLAVGPAVGPEVVGEAVGDMVGSDVVGVVVGDVVGSEVVGSCVGCTVGSEVVGSEVVGVAVGAADGIQDPPPPPVTAQIPSVPSPAPAAQQAGHFKKGINEITMAEDIPAACALAAACQPLQHPAGSSASPHQLRSSAASTSTHPCAAPRAATHPTRRARERHIVLAHFRDLPMRCDRCAGKQHRWNGRVRQPRCSGRVLVIPASSRPRSLLPDRHAGH